MTLVDSFLALHHRRFPASHHAAIEAAVAALRYGAGSDLSYVYLRDRLTNWAAGSRSIPQPFQDAMRAAVIRSFPGDFDRGGLIEAIALPVRQPIKPRKPVAVSD